MADIDLDKGRCSATDQEFTSPVSGEEAALERAAIALCWDARPALYYGSPTDADRFTWWQLQSEADRRLYLRRARVAIEEWEASCHA